MENAYNMSATDADQLTLKPHIVDVFVLCRWEPNATYHQRSASTDFIPSRYDHVGWAQWRHMPRRHVLLTYRDCSLLTSSGYGKHVPLEPRFTMSAKRGRTTSSCLMSDTALPVEWSVLGLEPPALCFTTIFVRWKPKSFQRQFWCLQRFLFPEVQYGDC